MFTWFVLICFILFNNNLWINDDDPSLYLYYNFRYIYYLILIYIKLNKQQRESAFDHTRSKNGQKNFSSRWADDFASHAMSRTVFYDGRKTTAENHFSNNELQRTTQG